MVIIQLFKDFTLIIPLQKDPKTDNIVPSMEQPELDKIYLFNKIVQAGSFSAAARDLNIPKSRLSRHLQQLEDSLGQQLIIRTTRQFQLTSFGKELFSKSAHLLEELRSLVESTSFPPNTPPQGKIKITTPEDFGVEIIAPLCSNFMQQYPLITIELILTDQIRDLIRESFDLAIRFGNLENSTLMTRKVGVASFKLVAGKNYFKKNKPIKKIEDLQHHPFIHFTGIDEQDLYTFSKPDKEYRVTPKISFKSNNIFVLKKMALESHGLLIIPSFMAKEEIQTKELIEILPQWKKHQSPVQILMPPQRKVVPKVRLFNDFLFHELKQLLS